VDKPSNSFLSLLNGIGIFSSGVLGALYTLSQKEKSAADATIETVSLFSLLCFLDVCWPLRIVSLPNKVLQ